MLKFLSSIGLALFLIASMAGMAVIATIVGNDSVYTSVPFLGLVVAFWLNLLLCTIKLLPQLKIMWRRNITDITDTTLGYDCYVGNEENLAQLHKYLQKGKYHIEEEQKETQTKILAKKNKLSLLAPHMLHVAILIILLGGAVIFMTTTSGGVFGYVDSESNLPMSVRQAIGDKSAEPIERGEKSDDYLSVQDFQTVYDEKGQIDNWVTRFDLTIDQQQVVTNGETKVNAPYRYQNMMIYQNSYGNHYEAIITGGEDAGGYVLPDGQHNFLADGEKTLMFKGLSDGRVLLKVFKVDTEGAEEVLIGQVVEPGDIVAIEEGVTIEYLRSKPYTILEVKVSKGSGIVLFGFLLACVASLLFWLGRYREIMVIAENEGNIAIKVVCKNKMVLESIQKELDQQLQKG